MEDLADRPPGHALQCLRGLGESTPGVVLPELVYLPPLATVSSLRSPASGGAPHEIRLVSDSPGAVLPKLVHLHAPPFFGDDNDDGRL